MKKASWNLLPWKMSLINFLSDSWVFQLFVYILVELNFWTDYWVLAYCVSFSNVCFHFTSYVCIDTNQVKPSPTWQKILRSIPHLKNQRSNRYPIPLKRWGQTVSSPCRPIFKLIPPLKILRSNQQRTAREARENFLACGLTSKVSGQTYPLPVGKFLGISPPWHFSGQTGRVWPATFELAHVWSGKT